MRIAIAALAVSLSLLVGCSSGQGGWTPQAQDSTPAYSRWNPYLVVMTDLERGRFLEIESDLDRELWLRRNGIDVRADLNRELKRGMTVADARRRLGAAPDEERRDGRTTTLFYSRFNTHSQTEFWLKFEDDSLLAWNSYTLEDQTRERELLDFQQRLMRNFNTVLERGIGLREITRTASRVREDLNRVSDAHRMTMDTRPADRGYLSAEQLLYARSRNQLFEWFQGREPDEVIRQIPFETYRYFTLHTDRRGRETMVTVEFIFQDQRLMDWFVYHER